MISPVTTLAVFGAVEDTETSPTPLKVGGVFTESAGSATGVHCHHISPVRTIHIDKINDLGFFLLQPVSIVTI